jgi:glucose-6-phosphate isomerase
MLKKDNFFKSYFIKSNKYNQNLKKTKKVFNSFLIDLENNKIPLLESYKKSYKFDFSLETIKKFSTYKNIIIIGMGGSILGTKSIYSFLKNKIKKNVFFFDNLDPNLIIKYKKIKNLNNSCFILVGKSGKTIETIINFGIIFSKKLLKNKLVVIAQPTDNSLIKIANKYQAEIIKHKEFISGRYSVLSETGMFPAAIMGLDLIKFKNLKNLIKNKSFVSSLIHNVACIYTFISKNISNSIILNYDSTLNDLGYWYQQLVAESLGKKGKGINPMLSFGPRDHHSLLQLYLDGPKDKFFTFLNSSEKKDEFKPSQDVIPSTMGFLKNKNLKFIINSQCNAVKNIFKLKKIPFRQITFNQKNEEEMGKIFTFFVLETILLSKLMSINPYDQPAVEQIKTETRKILG